MKPDALKFISILAFGLLFRLLPFRPPNVEPILASQMPLARHGGALAGFLFGVLSIVLYDIVTGTVGPWTLITASTYGALGLGAAWYFNVSSPTFDFRKSKVGDCGNHECRPPARCARAGSCEYTPPRAKPRVLPLIGENKTKRRHYVYFAIVGTLVYDAATGLTVGPLFFGQPFLAALAGQIPFTLLHLAGNVGFALTLSPMIDRLLTAKVTSLPLADSGTPFVKGEFRPSA